MDRVVYSPTAASILVWSPDATDIIVWTVDVAYRGKGLCVQRESLRTPAVINESIRKC